ncbi:MAG: CpaD family pilus assembly protein [Hyphomicrobiaceae bacterium]
MSDFRTRNWGRSARAIALAALVAVSTGGLSACRDDVDGAPVAGWSTIDPMVNHPIAVGVRPYQLSLELGDERQGLSRQQADDARRFFRRYRLQGATALVIDVPEHARGSLAESQVQALLANEAVPARAVRYVPAGQYGDGGSITMAFETGYVAHPPECGYWPENLSESRENVPYWNFGCAQSRNLAMMVDNPNDLIGPRRTTARSSDRRDVVWRKYVGGEATDATTTEVEQKANVSTTGQ